MPAVLKREEINKLLDDGYLDAENRFYRYDDGSIYVAALTKMPEVTPEMIDWWFWWYAKDSIRYQIWCPGKHYSTESEWNGTYNDETKSYRERLHHSTHVVSEDIGNGRETLTIDFMSPEAFGFDMEKMSKSKTETILCAKGGFTDKGVWTTDFCHDVRVVDKGIELRSRFWIGKINKMNKFGRPFFNSLLNFPPIKRKIIPKELGKTLFQQCSEEYSILADILPEVYKEAGERQID